MTLSRQRQREIEAEATGYEAHMLATRPDDYQAYRKLGDDYRGKPNYYNRSGEPISMLEWAHLISVFDYKVVEHTMVGPYLVSTVWLGMNHNWMGDTPIIFETMVFDQSVEETSSLGGDHEFTFHPDMGLQDRYSTEEQALVGHQYTVEKMQGVIDTLNELGSGEGVPHEDEREEREAGSDEVDTTPPDTDGS